MKNVFVKGMKKGVVVGLLAMVVAGAFTGCGRVNVNVEKSDTETHVETDANGNTTTTTTDKLTGETTVTRCAATEDGITTATLVFDNSSDKGIHSMYFKLHSSDDWGRDFLDEDEILDTDYNLSFEEGFHYGTGDNAVWDLYIMDEDGQENCYEGLDVTQASNPENIYFTITSENGALVLNLE